jgi:hypothetical protein
VGAPVCVTRPASIPKARNRHQRPLAAALRPGGPQQNVEFALPFIREALDAGLTITAIAKWYHRRTVHMLKTQVPGIGRFRVITWKSVYDGRLVTRASWPDIPDGSRRVVREWDEVSRRVADGTLAPASITGGAWS